MPKVTKEETVEAVVEDTAKTVFEQKPMQQMTIIDFENKIKEYYDAREEAQAAKHTYDKLKEREDYCGEILLGIMKEFGKSSYKSSWGHVIRSERWSWKTPKTDEQKKAFYDYLRSKGLFDSMISVNSQTLNSFAKKELEAAKEGGDIDFQIPGLEEPTCQDIISLRRT